MQGCTDNRDSHTSLKVVLVSRNDRVLCAMRAEVLECAAAVHAEFHEVGEALGLRRRAGDKLVFLVHVDCDDELAMLTRLSGAFPNSPILAVMDIALDSMTLLLAMRAGATQVLPLPLQPDDFRAVMDRIFIQYGGRESQSKTVIAVSGVTGGSGATTLALNLGYEIAQTREAHCIVIELSRSIGMLATYLDITPRFTIDDVLRNVERMDAHQVKQLLTPITDRFDIIAGLPNAGRQWSACPDELVRLVEYANRMADVTILDLPFACDDFYFNILSAVDQVVFVGEQSIPSVGMLKMISDSLIPEGIAVSKHLVINRYNPRLPGLTIESLEERLDVPKLHTIANDFASVSSAVNHGWPLRLESPRSRTLTDIDSLAGALLAEKESNEPSKPTDGILNRLARAWAMSF